MSDGEAIRDGVLAALPATVTALVRDAAPLAESVTAELEALLALMRDYPNRAGKTLRGRLTEASALAHGVLRGSVPHAAAGTLARAIELFQNWVLVHDDIEDASEERRGAPALHRIAGMPVALNVGDAMHVSMWQLLLTIPESGSYDRAALLDEFGAMIMRTAAGQHLDLTWVRDGRFDVGEAEYLDMVSLKTAYYTAVCPLRLGALSAGRSPSPLLQSSGLDIGVAFQIRDDVLNLQGGDAVGKEFAGDLLEGKRTLILAHFLTHGEPAAVARVMGYLRLDRGEKDPALLPELVGLIEDAGSLAYAQHRAESLLDRGMTALAEALAGLPGEEGRLEVLRLLRGVAEREA